jgi:dihydrofolate synthase/folylpolyglutamate synthase
VTDAVISLCSGDRAAHAEALAFLYGRIDYERTPTIPYQDQHLKLARMLELLARLGNPHERLPVVHVAGSKGKGSTAVMIAAIMTAAGYRTGLYTSPHLERLEERLVVAGQECSPEELVELVAVVRPAVTGLDEEAARRGETESGPTYFEITTAMAFLHFLRQGVEVAVLEVGLGGRLDSTNVCRPSVSVITSISLDHTQQLGNTEEAIAREKAGIIKRQVPVVSGVRDGEAQAVIEKTAQQQGTWVSTLGRHFDFEYRPHRLSPSDQLPVPGGFLCFRPLQGEQPPGLNDLPLGMLGSHQAANAALAIAACHLLRHAGWRLDSAAIRLGLAEARCPARVEIVARAPTVILDGSHNVASIQALLETCRQSLDFDPSRRVLVFATTRGKDASGMLRLLMAEFAEIILTRYQSNPRSIDPHQLLAATQQITADGAPPCRVTVCPNSRAAWEAARRLAKGNHLICVAGSFFIAGEIQSLARPGGSGGVAQP